MRNEAKGWPVSRENTQQTRAQPATTALAPALAPRARCMTWALLHVAHIYIGLLRGSSDFIKMTFNEFVGPIRPARTRFRVGGCSFTHRRPRIVSYSPHTGPRPICWRFPPSDGGGRDGDSAGTGASACRVEDTVGTSGGESCWPCCARLAVVRGGTT